MGHENTQRLINEIAQLEGLNLGEATTDTVAFHGATPVAQAAALTALSPAALTTMTAAAHATPDYAVQVPTQSTPFGFVTLAEAQSTLQVIINNQARIASLATRVGEIETILVNKGFCASV